jgi:hypothetical protein
MFFNTGAGAWDLDFVSCCSTDDYSERTVIIQEASLLKMQGVVEQQQTEISSLRSQIQSLKAHTPNNESRPVDDTTNLVPIQAPPRMHIMQQASQHLQQPLPHLPHAPMQPVTTGLHASMPNDVNGARSEAGIVSSIEQHFDAVHRKHPLLCSFVNPPLDDDCLFYLLYFRA